MKSQKCNRWPGSSKFKSRGKHGSSKSEREGSRTWWKCWKSIALRWPMKKYWIFCEWDRRMVFTRRGSKSKSWCSAGVNCGASITRERWQQCSFCFRFLWWCSLNEVIELCMEKYDLWYSVFSNKQSTSPTELSYRPPASPPISDPEAWYGHIHAPQGSSKESNWAGRSIQIEGAAPQGTSPTRRCTTSYTCLHKSCSTKQLRLYHKARGSFRRTVPTLSGFHSAATILPTECTRSPRNTGIPERIPSSAYDLWYTSGQNYHFLSTLTILVQCPPYRATERLQSKKQAFGSRRETKRRVIPQAPTNKLAEGCDKPLNRKRILSESELANQNRQ